MTNQEKKAELRKYSEAQAQADRLREGIARLYSKAEKMTTVLKLVPAGGGGDRKIESAIEGIDEIAGCLGEKQSEANRLRRKIEDAIATVSDGRLRLLLEYKYIDGLTWELIAEKMDTDLRWVYRLHGQALTALTIESHVESLILLD